MEPAPSDEEGELPDPDIWNPPEPDQQLLITDQPSTTDAAQPGGISVSGGGTT